MTCLEKLRELRPEWDEDKINAYIKTHCPEYMNIANDPIWCSMGTRLADCDACWNRRILTSNEDSKYTVWLTHGDAERLRRLTKRLDISHTEVVKAALKLYEDGLDAVDAARNRPTSVSFEVITDGSKEV